MKRGPSRTFYQILFFIAILCLPLAGQAQSVWLDNHDNRSRVGIQMMIPSYDYSDADGAAFASYLYSNIRLNDNLLLQLDVPVSHWSDGGGEANFAIGNPYVGLLAGKGKTKFDFGVRIPAVDSYEKALNTGLDIETYQFGAFLPNTTTITSNVHYRSSDTDGFSYRLGGGLHGFIPTEGGGGELFVKYYGQLLYRVNDLTFGGGIKGLLNATSSEGSFADRTMHNLGFSASYDLGKIDAGAYIETSIDDHAFETVDYILGLNLGVKF